MSSEALDEQTIREIVRDELDEPDADSTWTRRGLLAALGIGGAVATGSNPASAATPDGYLGSASDPLGAYLADVRGPGNGDAITFQQEIDTPAVQTEELSGTYRAEPGELQSKIDAANADGGGTVVGNPSKSFDPSATIEVKPDVRVVLAGKGIVLSSDIDVVNLHERSELYTQIDTSNVTYSSRVVTVDTATTGQIYDFKTAPEFEVEHVGTFGEGTAVYLHQNGTDDAVSFVDGTIRTEHVGTAVDIHSENSGGWINGNVLNISVRGAETNILERGAGIVKGNEYRCLWQPFGSGNSAGQSSIGWDVQTGGTSLLTGVLWDNGRYSTGMVRLGSAAEGGNTIRTHQKVVPSHIVNNAAVDLNVVREDRPRYIRDYGGGGGSGDATYIKVSGSDGRGKIKYYDSASSSVSEPINWNEFQVRVNETLDHQGNRAVNYRDVPGAIASDLANGEIATDSTNGRIVWKDDTGAAYYVSGSAL
jgi:hypothetical protein